MGCTTFPAHHPRQCTGRRGEVIIGRARSRSLVNHGTMSTRSVPSIPRNNASGLSPGMLRGGGVRGQSVVARMSLLDVEDAKEKLREVSGWEMGADSEGRLRLSRKWKVRNFPAGLELFQRLGEVAEDLKHHPDLHLEGWNKVKVEIWSHDTGGLTDRDFALAAKLSEVPVDDLLWVPKKKKSSSSP